MLSFKNFLLLEAYDIDQLYAVHGPKFKERAKSELAPEQFRGVPEEQHDEIAKNLLHNAIQSGDPSGGHKYGRWIASALANGDLSGERGISQLGDMGRVKTSLTTLQNKGQKLKDLGISRNIDDYKHLSDLEHALSHPSLAAPSKREKARDTLKDIDQFEDENWHIESPKTAKASQDRYGQTTRWCTAASEGCQFDSYHNDHPVHRLYVFKPKKHNPLYRDLTVKTGVQPEIESHIGEEIAPHHYREGLTNPDASGKQRQLARIITDKKLLDKFKKDPGRGGMVELPSGRKEWRPFRSNRLYQLHIPTNELRDAEDKQIPVTQVFGKRGSPTWSSWLENHLKKHL